MDFLKTILLKVHPRVTCKKLFTKSLFVFLSGVGITNGKSVYIINP